MPQTLREGEKHCFRLPEKRWDGRGGGGSVARRTRGDTNQERKRLLFTLLVKLLDVTLLDLAHEILAAEKIIAKLAGELARHDEELIVGDFVPCNGTARGNQVRAPLKHEAEIPKNKESEDEGSG